jgi:hypothetical protein
VLFATRALSALPDEQLAAIDVGTGATRRFPLAQARRSPPLLSAICCCFLLLLLTLLSAAAFCCCVICCCCCCYLLLLSAAAAAFCCCFLLLRYLLLLLLLSTAAATAICARRYAARAGEQACDGVVEEATGCLYFVRVRQSSFTKRYMGGQAEKIWRWAQRAPAQRAPHMAGLALGFGRIVALEIQAPNMLANLLYCG